MFIFFYCLYNYKDGWFYLFSSMNIFFMYRFSSFKYGILHKGYFNILALAQIFYRCGMLH